MPEGCDVSEHQGALTPEWFDQWDFCIIRAFNENGCLDRCFAANWRNSRGRTRRGVYGWPVQGRDNVVLGRDLVTVAPDAEAGYWADYENPPGKPLPPPADLESYLWGIGARLRGFYANSAQCPRSEFFDREHFWLADHGPNDGRMHDPYEQAPHPPRPWTLHQYTSNPLDRNWCPNLDWLGVRMATGQDLVDAARTFIGQPYSTAPGRDDPESGHKDCSGLIAASYEVATGSKLGATVSSTIFDLGVAHGLEIPLEQALVTPGACLLKPENPYAGIGPRGHIAFSVGDGLHTVEATPPRVQELPVAYNAPWSSRACLLPGINYTGDKVPPYQELDMELFVQNIDDDKWYYFPPFCAPARNVDADFVLGRTFAGVPHGRTNGPTIVAMDADRAKVRGEFVAEIKS